MKVVFVSNYYNHHQAPFSEAMFALTNGNYWFVATEEMSEERKNMGWSQEHLPEYVIKSYESAENLYYAKVKIEDADVVLFGLSGWRNFNLIQSRLKRGKITFRYSERIYKDGFKWYRFPLQLVKNWISGGRYQSMYLLCASAYAAQDYAKTRSYLNRTYKWGYFPKVKTHNVTELMKRKLSVTSADSKHPLISILWAGRLIDWKHPDDAIELAEALKEKSYAFKMSIIGNGEMEMRLRNMIRDNGLEDCVEMLGAMAPDKVRTYMEQADIYLFTSDFNEGWGAVLNESMNSGCAVVASHAIGAVPFLINNEVNGLIYENGNKVHLQRQVERLLENANYRRKIGSNAYHTIESVWNATVAAERLYYLCINFLQGNNTKDLFEDGPCSRAEIIKNDWLYR